MSDRTCSIDDCERIHYARGWCFLHYNRWHRHGDPHHGDRVEITSKVCPSCEADLPLDDFYPSKRHLGGVSYYCRGCTREVRREYYSRTTTPERRAVWAARQRLYLQDPANAARDRAKASAWAKANPERVNARNRAWRKANPEKAREISRRHRLANPEKALEYVERRRARKLNAPVNDFTTADWHEIVADFNGCCAYCLASGVRLQQEHMTPLSRGGSHTRSNIVPACAPCNGRKATMTLIEFTRRCA